MIHPSADRPNHPGYRPLSSHRPLHIFKKTVAAAAVAIVAGAAGPAWAYCAVLDPNYDQCRKIESLEADIEDLRNRVSELESASKRQEAELLDQLSRIWGRIADMQTEMLLRPR